MKKIIALLLVLASVASMSIPALAVTGLQVGQTATVSCNSAGLKIRATPSTSDGNYDIVGNGTEVMITSVPNSSWYGVKVTKYVKGSNGTGYTGLTGYAMANFIVGSTTTTPTNPPSNPTTPTGTAFVAVISGTDVNVRDEAGTGGDSLGTVSESDGTFTCYRPATAVYKNGHYWVQIKDNSNDKFVGDYGWIAATYVMAGNSMSQNRTACSVCGSSLSLEKQVRSQYKNTGNGYHNCNGGSEQLICPIYTGREIKTYTCNSNSSHPEAKTVIFTPNIRSCQMTAWLNQYN